MNLFRPLWVTFGEERMAITNYNILFFVAKNTGKMVRAQGKNTGNFVVIGVWQP